MKIVVWLSKGTGEKRREGKKGDWGLNGNGKDIQKSLFHLIVSYCFERGVENGSIRRIKSRRRLHRIMCYAIHKYDTYSYRHFTLVHSLTHRNKKKLKKEIRLFNLCQKPNTFHIGTTKKKTYTNKSGGFMLVNARKSFAPYKLYSISFYSLVVVSFVVVALFCLSLDDVVRLFLFSHAIIIQ